MRGILALDQGTTSSRAIVFVERGSIGAVAQKEFRRLFPRVGAGEALAKANVAAGDVAAIGITNQRETTLLWDRRTGKPVYNAIVWQDRRTAGFCDELKRAGHSDLIQNKTGLVIDAYFSGSKLRWLLDNVP